MRNAKMYELLIERHSQFDKILQYNNELEIEKSVKADT